MIKLTDEQKQGFLTIIQKILETVLIAADRLCNFRENEITELHLNAIKENAIDALTMYFPIDIITSLTVAPAPENDRVLIYFEVDFNNFEKALSERIDNINNIENYIESNTPKKGNRILH